MCHYEKVLSINLEAAEVHYNLVIALEASDEKSRAIKHYKICIEQDRRFVEAFINLENLYFNEGAKIEAI